METTPRISVIVPACNSEKYIEDALDSVFAQTYTNYEIIVANDGSTDHTPAILDRYGAKIQTVHLAHRGVSAARNRAIKQSQGELIALLDSDDMWEPTKLEKQVAYMDAHPEYALTYTYSTNFTDRADHNVALVRKMDFEGRIFKDLFTSGNPTTSTVIMRREAFDAVGGYDENLVAAEDYELNLRLARRYQMGRVAESLLRRRIHPDSLFSSGYDSQYTYTLPVYEKLLSDPAITQELGVDKMDYLGSFVCKFVFKSLYDGRLESLAEKLGALEAYDPKRARQARILVAKHDISPESWEPLIVAFEPWYADVKHKAALFNRG